jgi:hypothetical protein
MTFAGFMVALLFCAYLLIFCIHIGMDGRESEGVAVVWAGWVTACFFQLWAGYGRLAVHGLYMPFP